MEQKLQYSPVFINEIVLDETVEQPIECDALLPDYCPDILRILRCTVEPVVMSRSAAGGKLTLEGLAGIHVLYCAENGEPARGEYKVPFTRVLELPGEEKPLVRLSLRAGEINCRAVSPRRLDVRASVLIKVFAVTVGERDAVSGSGDGTVELLLQEKKGVRLAGITEREERLTEMTSLPGTGAPVLRVLRTQARVKSGEQKAENGRVTVRGEVVAEALLLKEDGGLETAECTLPYESRMEIPEAGAETPLALSQEVVLAEAEPRTDEDGENRAIAWDVTLSSVAESYLPYENRIAADCYGTRYETTGKKARIRTLELLRTVEEPEDFREALPLPAEAGEPILLTVQEGACSVRPEGEALLAETRLSLFILARMNDGELHGFPRVLELSRRIAAPRDARWNAAVSCRDLRWECREGELRLECSLLWSGAVWRLNETELLEDVTVDETKPHKGLRARGFYLYLAQPGESLWEIARRYNTSVERILADNEGLTERKEGGPILIPV